MKIQSSSISMASTHNFSSYSHAESLTIQGKASDVMEGVVLSLSKEAENGNAVDAMKNHNRQKRAEIDERQSQRMKTLVEIEKAEREEMACPDTSDEYKLKLELLKRMFAMLSKGGELKTYFVDSSKIDWGMDLRSHGKALTGQGTISSAEVSARSASGFTLEAGISALPTTGAASSVWTRITATSGILQEYESTTFASQGKVQTEDGRSIDFNVSFSMSRAFEAEINNLEVSNYIVTDPLVINLDTDMTEISDQKFFFDLNTDGKEEEISFVGKGSGFLALDKNGDGVINDGSELFGTKSGDGFQDLAAYNEDGNLWIDENDSIFHKLKVWTKDEDGNDILMNLKEADVGAVYLGNAKTEFSYKDESNTANAFLRKTGVYLKESTGAVGTVSHVDMVL